ncbi:MAG TPA: ESPR-type extended signal peptide-containing protein, partial [Opitutaceae bacterium]
MNKAYRSVWNESTGTWMAVQENAKGRGKSVSKVASVAVAAVVSGLAAQDGSAAMIFNNQPGTGCYVVADSYSRTGSGTGGQCGVGSAGANTVATGQAYGNAPGSAPLGSADILVYSSTSLAGKDSNIDSEDSMSMSGYLDVWKTATFHGGVDLKGNTISNLANGSADGDAVNVAQLKAAGLNVDTSGNVTGAFVAYDDVAKGKITLAGGTAGTAITNVKAGA